MAEGCIFSHSKLDILDSRMGKYQLSPTDTSAKVCSQELSKEGKAMYGNEPYLVKNRATCELVLFHPDQVRDFFKQDAQCKS